MMVGRFRIPRANTGKILVKNESELPVMKTVPLCLLTIAADAILKERLIADVRSAGAKGYTVTDAEGEGLRQRCVGEIPGTNIRLETIVSAEVADRLLTLISVEYFERYAVDVAVHQHPLFCGNDMLRRSSNGAGTGRLRRLLFSMISDSRREPFTVLCGVPKGRSRSAPC